MANLQLYNRRLSTLLIMMMVMLCFVCYQISDFFINQNRLATLSLSYGKNSTSTCSYTQCNVGYNTKNSYFFHYYFQKQNFIFLSLFRIIQQKTQEFLIFFQQQTKITVILQQTYQSRNNKMGNQHLSKKYPYDGQSKYILPNKVHNPYGVSSNSNEKNSKLRKSFNQEKSVCFNKSNVNRNLFGDYEGQTHKKSNKKHQRSHSYTIIGLTTNECLKNKQNANQSALQYKKAINTQIGILKNENRTQNIDLEKLFGKCDIDTKRAIGDSNMSYIAALDSRIQNLRECGQQRSRQKDDIVSISTKRHVISHCDLLKPRSKQNQQVFRNRKGIEQTRKRENSMYEKTIEPLSYLMQKQVCNKQIQAFPQLIQQQFNSKFKEKSNRSRKKTQTTVTNVQNSRLKIQRLQEQLLILKKQIQMQYQEQKNTQRNVKKDQLGICLLNEIDEQGKVEISGRQRSCKSEARQKIKQIKNAEKDTQTYEQCIELEIQQKITKRKIKIEDFPRQYRNQFSFNQKAYKNQILSYNEAQSNEDQIQHIQKRMYNISDRVQPPFQQFLSTQPICQQILKEDHLSIIKQYENVDESNEEQGSSIVRSFKHNKSEAYFGIELQDEAENLQKNNKLQRHSQIEEKRELFDLNSRFLKYSDRLKGPITRLNNLNYIKSGRKDFDHSKSYVGSAKNID